MARSVRLVRDAADFARGDCAGVPSGTRGRRPARPRSRGRHALANAVVIAVYTIIEGSGARLAGNAWSYIVWLLVLDTIPFSLYMVATRRGGFVSAMMERGRRGVIGASLSAAAYAISVWAMTKAPLGGSRRSRRRRLLAQGRLIPWREVAQ
jgi:hypothetical protein